MKNIKITAKDIVKFIHSGGDLTSEFQSNKRALEGIEAHSYLQNKYKECDKKEVSVETLFEYGKYSFYITGRMDGLLIEDKRLIIEEIKSTKADLALLEIDTRPEHLMQAKMYAYMYAKNNNLKSINVRLTYIAVEGYKAKSFNKRYNFSQLTKFFTNTIEQYVKWLEIFNKHQEEKLMSIEGLVFPFEEYREGQHKFMGAVYQTLIKKDILYSIAPTGIGKTIGSLYSALKTIKNEKEKIFYLTAKNAGKKIVVDTVNLLKENGLICKTTVINSKESMCLMDKVDCDPEICPYAKGFFDRLREAVKDIFVHNDVYDMKLIKAYGELHSICPHEFSLELSNYSDLVICDYNYAFDPRVHLIRYFEDDYYTPKLLIDEAHNMVDRSRNMYSASLKKESLINLRKAANKVKPSIKGNVKKLIDYIDQFVVKNEIEKARFFNQDDMDMTLIKLTEVITNKLERVLAENKKFTKRDQILEGYFELLQFVRISEFYNDNYQYIVQSIDDDIVITLSCLDASNYILDTIESRVSGVVLFSATLFPVDYYVKLITKGVGKTISIPSPFTQSHLGLFVDESTSTRYRDRPRSVGNIIDSIYAIAETKIGNYIIFFPSYVYLNMVLEEFNSEEYEMLIQTRNMSSYQRNKMLNEFNSLGDRSRLGFFVLGGSFSEGIDYIGDMLSGVLIVGVAMPQFNKYNELLRNHFDNEFNEGFDYAYTYPGMNKVIQAVGRVIRTNDDLGIAVLFDDRYSHPKYRSLFPKNWSHYIPINKGQFLQSYIAEFWNKQKKE
ncbi:MAG: PD-(D/E)XK nuclease family protein [Candidatus Izimaplasma sp.]|nr:PD-(D/E)XK nuclease family protein [Candidatus Izimaplasma bacterium]